jgi:hypothetical protein
MATFATGVAVITWAAFRDRDSLSGSGLLLLVLTPFWLAGIAGCFWAVRQHTVRTELVGLDRLILVRSTPFRSTRLEVTRDMIGRLLVQETTDSDGDPYFRGVLTIAGIGDVNIVEGHNRAQVEASVGLLRTHLGI